MSKKWSQGKIIIKLNDDKYRYEIGEVIRGTVRLEQQTFFSGHELQVGFDGAEFTLFKGLEDEAVFNYSGKNPFMHVTFPLKKYEDKKAPAGESEFEFAFRIADWLPQSFIFASEYQQLSMKRTYCIFA